MEAAEDEPVDPDKGGGRSTGGGRGSERRRWNGALAAAMGWRGREVRRCDGEAERGADRVWALAAEWMDRVWRLWDGGIGGTQLVSAVVSGQ
jgi:hypothetical protein